MSTTRKALFTLAALGLISFTAHPASAQTIINGSFEANSFAAFPGYVNFTYNGLTNGTISGWTSNNSFSGLNPYTSGQNNDRTGSNPFANNGKTPDGAQVAFLQGGGTTLTQTLNNLVIGNVYQVSFYDNSRTNQAGTAYGIPTLSLLVGGNTLFSQTITPVDTYQSFKNPYNFMTVSFVASASSTPLQFANTTASGDATALIDNVSIRNMSPASAAPEPSQIGILALVAISLGALAVKARKRTTAAQTV